MRPSTKNHVHKMSFLLVLWKVAETIFLQTPPIHSSSISSSYFPSLFVLIGESITLSLYSNLWDRCSSFEEVEERAFLRMSWICSRTSFELRLFSFSDMWLNYWGTYCCCHSEIGRLLKEDGFWICLFSFLGKIQLILIYQSCTNILNLDSNTIFYYQAYFYVHYLAFLINIYLLSLYYYAISRLEGLKSLGRFNSVLIFLIALVTVRGGDQSGYTNSSTKLSLEMKLFSLILGWYIFVMNWIFRVWVWDGYSMGTLIDNSKSPPS